MQNERHNFKMKLLKNRYFDDFFGGRHITIYVVPTYMIIEKYVIFIHSFIGFISGYYNIKHHYYPGPMYLLR